MTYTPQSSIVGTILGTPAAWIAWAKKHGVKRVDEFERYVRELYRLAALRKGKGPQPHKLITQMLHETGGGTSYWWVERLNPAGIGITGDPKQNAASKVFADGVDAARAHYYHASEYSDYPVAPEIAVYRSHDPRAGALPERLRGTRQTLESYGTVDPVNNPSWAWDPKYGELWAGWLNRLAPVFAGAPADGGTDMPDPQDVIDIIRDIVNEPYAPPVFLDYLEGADPGQMLVRRDNQAFFRVNAEVKAIRPTPRYQKAVRNGLKRGPDMETGDTAYIEYAWIARDGELWLYSDYGTRFYGPDFIRVDGRPIEVPDPDPTPQPKPGPKPGEITAENYRDVEDPAILLPPIEWVGSPNFFPNRHGRGNPIAIVYHCTDDLNYANTKSWFQNPASQASSTMVILRDGSVKQFVSSKDAPWTNGDWQRNGVPGYRRDIPWLVEAIAKGHNVNDYTISYEFIATPSVPPTEAQYQAAIKLSRYFCHPKVYAISPDRGHQMRHSDVNSITRSYCPGPEFQLERVIRELGGDPTRLS